MRLDEICQRGRTEYLDAIVANDDVAWSQVRCGRGRVRLNLLDDGRLRGIDQHLSRALSLPATRLGFIWSHIAIQNLPGPLDLKRNGRTFAAHNVPNDAVVHSGKAFHRLSIYLEDPVT